MSNPNALHLRHLPAADVIERMLRVVAEAFPNEPVSIFVRTNVGLNVQIGLAASGVASHPEIVGLLQAVKGKTHLSCSEFRASHQGNANFSITYRDVDGISAVLEPGQHGDRDRALRLLSAIETNFNVTSYVDIVRESSVAIDNAGLALRERAVADLRTEIERLAAFLAQLSTAEAEARRKWQQEAEIAESKRQAERDEAFRRKQEEVEAQAKNAQEKLLADRAEFEAKVKHYDLNDPKISRRKLQQQIDDVLRAAERTQLSAETIAKRKPIAHACFLTCSFAVVLALSMLWMVVVRGSSDWHYFVVLGSSVALFASTLVFYFRWSDRWFRDHSDAEFSAKRYKADILRAAWVAEWVQEWERTRDREIPQELLSAYTRGLFSGVGPGSSTEHPIDDITSLIKRATRVDIGKGLFSVRTSRPTATERNKHSPAD